MAAQGERELGDIDMGEGLLDPMAQDKEVEQEMLGVGEEQFTPPQMDPEPEMGAAAEEAAAHDTSPPPPHQNPPTLLGQGAIDMILQAMKANSNEMRVMNEKMENNMKEEMNGNA